MTLESKYLLYCELRKEGGTQKKGMTFVDEKGEGFFEEDLEALVKKVHDSKIDISKVTITTLAAPEMSMQGIYREPASLGTIQVFQYQYSEAVKKSSAAEKATDPDKEYREAWAKADRNDFHGTPSGAY